MGLKFVSVCSVKISVGEGGGEGQEEAKKIEGSMVFLNVLRDSNVLFSFSVDNSNSHVYGFPYFVYLESPIIWLKCGNPRFLFLIKSSSKNIRTCLHRCPIMHVKKLYRKPLF